MLKHKADLAVHSLKDLPTELPAGLGLGAVGKRADARDVLIYRDEEYLRRAEADVSSADWSPGQSARRGFRPGLRIRDLPAGAVPVDTDKASPFAQSLLFRWIAVYMYEYDAPMAERRAAALSLDRDLLRELLGAEDLRELIDPHALPDLELELQALAEGRRARNPDDLHDLLRLAMTRCRVRGGCRTSSISSSWMA